jgi:HK97 family phage prohead protease
MKKEQMSKKNEVKQKKHTSTRELRTTIQGSRLEVREQNGTKKLAGYAVVFNSPADLIDFTEIIAPGSFTRTLREDDQVMLRDHKSELLLGRVSAGTLKLTQDDIGLAFELTVPNTSLGQDTYESVRLGNLQGCSFGFLVRHDTWKQDGNGRLTRIIDDVMCMEVTLTAFPAYEATSVDLRSIREKLKKCSKRDLDDDDDDYRPECDPDAPDYDPDACPDEDDDVEERCSCECSSCSEGDCEDCTNPDCDDDDCDGCPIQTRQAHSALLLRRLRN